LKRVLFLAPWFPNAPGDREGIFIYESAAALGRFGLSVAVLVARPWLRSKIGQRRYKSLSERFDAAAFNEFGDLRLVHYLSIPGNRLPKCSARLHDRTVGKALLSFAKAFNADVIHAHSEGEAPVAIAVGRGLNLPVVVTLHGINTAPNYFKSAFFRARFKTALAAADRVILVGKPLQTFFTELVGSGGNFRIVPNGFDPPKISHVPYTDDRLVRFISVSNLHQGKGIDIAIRAMAKARSQGLEAFNFTVVGDGFERESLERLVADLGLKDKVRFVGACPHGQVYDWLRQADVFVLPSFREAFGVAYLEAMAVGLLAIGVDGEGPSAFISDGKTGLLVPPCDSDRLAQRLIAIASNRDAMRKIAAAGQTHVLANWTWDQHAQRLVSLYADLTSFQRHNAPANPDL
jgi:glycosyltransferase involved in cell wall biosynthesis